MFPDTIPQRRNLLHKKCSVCQEPRSSFGLLSALSLSSLSGKVATLRRETAGQPRHHREKDSLELLWIYIGKWTTTRFGPVNPWIPPVVPFSRSFFFCSLPLLRFVSFGSVPKGKGRIERISEPSRNKKKRKNRYLF